MVTLCLAAIPLAQCMKGKDWGQAREEKAPWRSVRRCAKGQPGSGVNPHTEFTSSWPKQMQKSQRASSGIMVALAG